MTKTPGRTRTREARRDRRGVLRPARAQRGSARRGLGPVRASSGRRVHHPEALVVPARDVPVHPRGPDHEDGRGGDRPRHPGAVPLRERDLDARLRLARRLLRALRVTGRRDRDQPVRRRHAHEAPDLHDAVRIAPGRVVHRLVDGLPLRRAQPAGPEPWRADRDGDPGDDDDGARLPAGHDDRLRDHPQRAARRAQPARVRGARGGDVRGVGPSSSMRSRASSPRHSCSWSASA